MAKYHEIDAPELQLDSSPIEDNSALSFVYPDPPKDTRPILKSDAERHALQQSRLNRSVDGVLKHGFTIGLLQVIPFAYAAILGTFVYKNLLDGSVGVLVPTVLIGSAFWVIILVSCYRMAMELLHKHGVSGASVATITLAALGVGGFAVAPAAYVTNDLFTNGLIFSGYLAAISIVTTYILLFVAVNSYHRGSGQG